jgi:hypothetical protein
MAKNFKLLWRLSILCAQNVFVQYSYYPTFETDLLQIGGLAQSSICSRDLYLLI